MPARSRAPPLDLDQALITKLLENASNRGATDPRARLRNFRNRKRKDAILDDAPNRIRLRPSALSDRPDALFELPVRADQDTPEVTKPR